MAPLIRFATSNPLKLMEAQACIPGLEAIEIHIPEIQAVDVADVVRDKLSRVAGFAPDYAILVEDTGLYVDALNGLPGTLVKWFVDGIGTRTLSEMLRFAGDAPVVHAVSAVGVSWKGKTAVWTGQTTGVIVAPRGDELGWNTIFQEVSTNKTFGEMTFAERLTFSMRREPLLKARDWIARGLE